MQQVRLVGNIAKFGEVWETNCTNIRDIFKLIECQTTGFRQYLLDAAHADVGFAIQRGDEFLENPEELLLSIGSEDIIITEVPAGSKSGFAKILAAIAIVALTVVSAGGFAGLGTLLSGGGLGAFAAQGALLMAANLALTGISQLMAPGPETDKKENEGYLFNGPVNNIAQGIPVPVIYGELKVGGAPISVSFIPDSGGTYGNGAYVDYGIGATVLPAYYNGWYSQTWAIPNSSSVDSDYFTVKS